MNSKFIKTSKLIFIFSILFLGGISELHAQKRKVKSSFVLVCDLDTVYRFPVRRGGCQKIINSPIVIEKHQCSENGDFYQHHSAKKAPKTRFLNNYGLEGSTKYFCENCKITLNLKTAPNDLGFCEFSPGGGLRKHKWVKK